MKPGIGGAACAHLLMVAVATLLLPVMVVQATPLIHLPHPAHFQTLPCLLPECKQETCCWHCWRSQVNLRLQAGYDLCFLFLVVVNVLYSDSAATYCRPVEIVYSKDCAALIFVGEKRETPVFACVPVLHVVHINELAVLCKHCEHVSFCQVKWQASCVDVS